MKYIAGFHSRVCLLPVILLPLFSLASHAHADQTLREAYLALAAVQVEKAEDYRRSSPPNPEEAEKCLSLAAKLIAVRNPEKPPGLVRHGMLLEHAYFARNDSSPQPYFIYVPGSYDPAKPSPMIMFLHGWVPETSRTNPWLASDDVIGLAERYGVIFVIPHGRTNTDFQYAGETDVLRVKEEVEKLYRVDPDRVYLTGASMGGAGTWQIGMHYPHLFAGIAPINAQGDWFRFWHEKFDYPTREKLPRHIQRLLAMHNPLDLAGNLSNLYSYSQHATTCFLGVGHTKDVVRRLKNLGAPHDFFEDPSELGHYIYWRVECWERAFRQLLPQVRKKQPEEVNYTTYSLRFPGAYWINIKQFLNWGVPASIKARKTGKGTIRIKSDNVAVLSLEPPGEWAAENGSFRVLWNDTELQCLPDENGRAVLRLPGFVMPKKKRLMKTETVCGPASDVFNFPFIAVRGTVGTQKETTASKKLAERFADDWKRYAEGKVEIIRDVDLTERMIQDNGLVLFGIPESNSMIKRIASSLPFKLSRKGIVLPDGKHFAGDNIGIVLTYPNPLAPDRYVLIYHGIPWGGGRSNNHKFDLLPDFTVFTPEIMPGTGINRFLAAGFFDEYWQYNPELTDYKNKRGRPLAGGNW